MARLFLTPLDLQGNELRNVRLQALAAAPTPASEGLVYYNSAKKRGEIYDGTTWVPLKLTVSGTGLVLSDGDLHIDPTTLSLTGNADIANLQTQITALANKAVDLSTAAGTGLTYSAGTGRLSVDPTYINGLITTAAANFVTLDGAQTVTGVKTFAATATPLINETIDPTTAATSLKAVNVKYVQTVVTNLINGAPGILDTLGEIATALQNDESAAAALLTRVSTAETNIGTNTTAITNLTTRVTALEAGPAKARKYAATLTTSATSYSVTHGLATSDVLVQLYAVSGGALVDTSVTVTDANTVSLSFTVAPAANAYRVVIVG